MRGLVPLLLAAAAAVPGQWIPPGWRALFNNRDLDGWSVAGAQGKPAYTVKDASLRTQPGRGLLWYSREKIGNCTVRVVYRMSNGDGRSGILLRLPEAPANEAAAVERGVEVRIDDRQGQTGGLAGLTKALVRAFKPDGEWNTMDITLAGARTIVKLNGALVSDYQGRDPAGGYMALRHTDDRAVLEVREISVK